ncbi:flagellar biosynthesis protein FlhF [Pseudomonas aeruginosa]
MAQLFTAASMRQCLEDVAKAFGDSAIILERGKNENGQHFVRAVAGTAVSDKVAENDAARSSFVSTSPAVSSAQKAMGASAYGTMQDTPVEDVKPFTPGFAAAAEPKNPELVDPKTLDFDRLSTLMDERLMMDGRRARGLEAEPAPAVKPEPAVVAAPVSSASVAAPEVAAAPERAPEPKVVVQGEVVGEEMSLNSTDMLFNEDIKRTEAIAAWSGRMLSEAQNMQDIVRKQLLPRFAETSVFSSMHRGYCSVGIRPELIPDLIGNMPSSLSEKRPSVEEMRALMESSLSERLDGLASADIWSVGRTVLAVVGGPGSGKSSTIAKLASRYALRNRVEEVAIVSLDSGNFDQLKTHADMLGVDFYLLEEHQSLSERLRKLEDKALVLIDTAGCSHRDERLISNFKRLAVKGQPVTAMLVISASQDADSLEAMAVAFRDASVRAGIQMHECSISKLDESVRLGGLISTISRHGLRLAYQSNGRDIMDDFDRASTTQLVRMAFDAAGEFPSVQKAFSDSEKGQRFENLRESVMENLTEISNVLTVMRREMKNVGFNEATRAVTGSVPARGAPLLEKPEVTHVSRSVAMPSPTPTNQKVMWVMNDIPVNTSFGGLRLENRMLEGTGDTVIGISDVGGREVRLS